MYIIIDHTDSEVYDCDTLSGAEKVLTDILIDSDKTKDDFSVIKGEYTYVDIDIEVVRNITVDITDRP